MAIASILASMANWSTPTILFCVLNLMIATIFIASNFKSPNHHHHNNIPSQLTRSPSLLERVKSVNLSSIFYTTPESHDQYNSTSQLSRRPSLLQRVKSIDFSFSSFHNSFSTESEPHSDSLSERTRTLSLLDRVKSSKLTSPFDSDQHSDHTSSSKDEDSDINPHHDSVEDNNVTSGESQYNELDDLTEKYGVTPANRSPSKLTKSGSEKKVAAPDDEENDDRRRPETKKAAVEVHGESVDAQADDFIKRFKQKLKLQRLDSLQRFREMLHRGT
ncbi:hypothetical protein L1987_53964 [Smallanthus sonchifolius]|uniref:Uncharacterized protein n=1 Tax=Smallanthus sonchifolius TaxID=185202 RepID=A0ACB9E5X8_9ASTR|nr:hypothetical protein L1987_53964 [Smallanthus sonchifolius]